MENDISPQEGIIKKIKNTTDCYETQESFKFLQTDEVADKFILINQQRAKINYKHSTENQLRSPKHEKDHQRYKKEKFTHFFSLPLHTSIFKTKALTLMDKILSKFDKSIHHLFCKQDLEKIHITLSMLALKDGINDHYTSFKISLEDSINKVAAVFQNKEKEILGLLDNQVFSLNFGKIGVFWDRHRGKNKIIIYFKPRIIYLEIKQDENLKKLNKLSHTLISEMLSCGVIKHQNLKSMNLCFDKNHQTYRPETYHVTLFRVKNDRHQRLEGINFEQILAEFQSFEFGTINISRLDVSTRFKFDIDNFYFPLSTMRLKQENELSLS